MSYRIVVRSDVRSRVVFILPLVIALVTSLLSGCGKKGDPLPPQRFNPAITQDLTLSQQGDLLVVRLGYPQTTASGTVLPGLQALELWSLEAAPEVDVAAMPESLFATRAQRVLTLDEAELRSSVTGNRIVARFPMSNDLRATGSRVFAIRTVSTTGEPSDYSNRVAMVLGPAPDPPTQLEVIAREVGIELGWSAAGDETEFAVYRREARDRTYAAPIGSVVSGDPLAYLDQDVEYGQRYFYTVRSIANREPLVESAAAVEVEIDYQDRFAPAPPTGLNALPEPGRVRLVWEPSPSDDATAYVVYRQDPQAEFRRVSEEPVGGLEYLDTGLAAGQTYIYRLSAVDGSGNEGETGQEVQATIPQ